MAKSEKGKKNKPPKDDMLDGLNAAEKLQQKLNQRIEQGSKLLDKYNSNLDLAKKYQDSITNASNDINKFTQANINNTKKLAELKQKISKSDNTIADTNKGINEINRNIKSSQQEINDLIQKGAPKDTIALKELGLQYQYEELRNQKKILKHEQDLAATAQAEIDALPEKNKQTKNHIKDIQTTLDLTSKNLDTLEDLYKNKRNIGKEDFKSLSYAKDIQDLEDQIADASEKGQNNLAASLTERRDLLKTAQKEADAQDKINSKIAASRDKIVAFGDTLLNLVPGGKDGYLGKMLGLDTISKNLKDKVGSAMSKAFEQGEGGITAFFKAGISGAGALLSALGPILLVVLAIAGVVALVKLFADADKQVAQLSKDLGISYKEAIKVKDAAVDIASEMNMVGVTSKEVAAQMVELKKATGLNFGILAQTNEKAKAFLETSTLLTAQYGMTADETVGLNQAAAVLGTTVDKIGLGAEKLGDEFVSSTEIMKEISKTSKTILFNFKGNVGALTAAVKQAKLMGTTLDAVSQAGDKLLDIENSLVAENKVRLLLGKNIQLDAARYYAMQGDTVNLMNELKKQMPSIAEYEKMMPMHRRMYAEALGMSLEQLDGMMAKQKELETLGLDALELEEKMKAARVGALDIQAEINNLGSKEAKDMFAKMANEQRRAGIQEKLASTIQKVTDLLFKMVEPLLPMIDDFVASLGNGEGMLSSIGDTFKAIGSFLSVILKTSGAFLKGALIPISIASDIISKTFTAISSSVSWIKKNLFGISDAAEETSGSMETIKIVATAIGVIIGLWFAKVAITKVVNGFTSMANGIKGAYNTTKDMGASLIDSAKGFKDGIKGAADEGGGFFNKLKGGIKGLFKKKAPSEEAGKGPDEKVKVPEVDTKGAEESVKKTKSFADRLNSMFKSINDTLKAIYKGVGDMLKNVFNFIKDTIKTITKFITDVLSDLLKAVKKIGNELASAFKSLLKNIQTVLNTAIDVIEDVGTNLIGAVEKLLVKVFKTIKTVGKEVISTLNTLLKGIQKVLIKAVKVVKNVGKEIISTFGELIQGVADVISGAGVSLVSSIGDLIGAIIDVLSTQGTALVDMLGDIGAAVVENVFKIVNTLLEGLGEAAGQLPNILGSLGKAVGSFFQGLGSGLLAFGEMMATPTPLGVPVGLIVVGMALGLASAARIAAPAIAALGPMFEGLAEVVKAIGPVIESVGNAIASVITAIGDSASKFISTMADSIVKLGEVNVLNLIGLAGALGALALGIGALTAGSIVSGVADFFGAGPADLLNDLADVNGAAIKSTSDAIGTLVNVLKQLKDIDSTSIENISESLGSLSDGILALTGGSVLSGLSSFFGAGPVDLLKDLADINSSSLQTTSKSIESLAVGISKLGDSAVDSVGDSIASLTESLDDLSDIDGGDLMDMANAIVKMSTGFDSLSASLNKLPGDAIAKVKELSKVAGETTGQGLFGSISSSINGAIESVKTGFGSISGSITSSITSGFDSAWNAVSSWFGQSPSEIGLSIVNGVKSVSGDLQSNLTSPFTGAADTVNGTISGIKDTMESIPSVISKDTDISGIENLQNVDVDKIKDVSNQLKGLDINSIKETLTNLSEALDVIDWDQLKMFSELANSNLELAATSLVKGINALTSIKQETAAAIPALEDSFDLLEDALDELDWEQLKVFSSLASTDLGKAGENIIKGINSIANIDTSKIDLSGTEDVFDLLEDVLDELNLDDLVKFGSLANVSFSNIATSLKTGLEELVKIGSITGLDPVEDVFDLVEDIIDELDLEELQSFGQINAAGISSLATALYTGITELAKLGDMSDVLGGVENTFDLLEDVIDELDLEQLQSFGSLNLDGLSTLATALSTAITSIAEIGDKSDALSGVESTFDLLEDAISELDLAGLVNFASMQIDPMAFTSVADALKNAIISLSDIGNKADQISATEDTFSNLSSALDELDVSSIQEFSNLKLDTFSAVAAQLSTALQSLSSISGISISGTSLDGLNKLPDIINNFSKIKSFETLTAITPVLSSLGSSLGAVGTNATPAAQGLTLLQQALISLTEIDIQVLVSLADALMKIATALQIMVSIAPGIAVLADAIKLLAESFVQLATSTTTLTTALAGLNAQLSTLNPALQVLVKNLTDLTALIPSIQELGLSITNLGTSILQFAEVAVQSAPPIQTLSGVIDSLGKSMASIDPFIDRFSTFVTTLTENVDGIYAVAEAIGTLADAFQKMTDSVTVQSGGFFGIGGESINVLDDSANALAKMAEIAPVVASAFQTLGATVDDAMALLLMIKELDKINADKFEKLGSAFQQLPQVYVVDTYNNIQKQEVQSAKINTGMSIDFDEALSKMNKDQASMADTKSAELVQLFNKVLADSLPEEAQQQIKPIIEKQQTGSKELPGDMKTEMSTNTSNDLKNVEQLLRELIAKVDQPVIVKIGEKAVSEISSQISFRKSYAANMNTGRA